MSICPRLSRPSERVSLGGVKKLFEEKPVHYVRLLYKICEK